MAALSGMSRDQSIKRKPKGSEGDRLREDSLLESPRQRMSDYSFDPPYRGNSYEPAIESKTSGDQLRQQTASPVQALSKLRENLDTMKGEVEGKMNGRTSHAKTIEELQRKLESASREAEQNKKIVEKVKEDNDSLQREKRTLQEEKRALQEEKRVLQEEKRVFQEEKKALLDQVRKLQADLTIQKDNNKKLVAESDQMMKDIELANVQVTETRKLLSRLS